MRGAWYQEWMAPAPLRAHLACSWAGQISPDGDGYTDRVLPDGCVDIVWAGSQLLVAGPDTGPVPFGRTPGGSFAGVRFAIGAAPAFLGLPSSWAAAEMEASGYALIHGARTERWGQTVARLLSPEGLLVGLASSGHRGDRT